MTVFADSSALVKLYADEEYHGEIRELVGLVVSQLARVEVPAAIWRKSRSGELDPASAVLLAADFEADFFGSEDRPARFAVVGLGTSILDDAARLVAAHGLRAYDAIQLAAARAAAAADPDLGHFAAFDRDLARAAAAEGFVLAPVLTG